MSDPIPESLFEEGPFYTTNQYVIATHAGPGYGNTVAQCFPFRRTDGTVISANQLADLLARALNEKRWSVRPEIE